MTSLRRGIDVDATKWRHIDIGATSLRRRVPVGMRSDNVLYDLLTVKIRLQLPRKPDLMKREMFISGRRCAETLTKQCRLKVQSQLNFMEFHVLSISPLPLEGFSSYFGQMLALAG